MSEYLMPQSAPPDKNGARVPGRQMFNRQQRRALQAQLQGDARETLRRLGFVPSAEELHTLARQAREAGALTKTEYEDLLSSGCLDHPKDANRLASFRDILDKISRLLAKMATEFLGTRFAGGERFELSAMSPVNSGRESAGFTLPRDHAECEKWIRDRLVGKNLYFGRDQRSSDWDGTRAAQSGDVASSGFAFFDFDRKAGEDDAAWEARRNDLEQRGRDLGATEIVRTGGGVHLHFKITPSSDRVEMDRRARLLNAAGKTIGSDPVSDLPRIARLPSTLNIPAENKRERGQTLAIAYPIFSDPNAPTHDPDDLAKRLSAALPQSGKAIAALKNSAMNTQSPGRNLRTCYPDLVVMAVNELPNDGPYDERDDCVRIVAAVKGAAGDDADVDEALRDFLARWHLGGDPEKDEKLLKSIDATKIGWPHVKAELAQHNPEAFLKIVQEEARRTFRQSPLDHDKLRVERKEARGGRRRSSERAMAALEAAGVTFWRDPDANGYVRLPGAPGENGRSHPLEDKAGRDAVEATLYKCGMTLSKTEMSEQLSLLEARARYEGETKEPVLRFAFRDGVIYLDSAGPDGTIFKVHAGGSEIAASADLEGAPFRFVQTDGMAAMPLPTAAAGSFIDQFDPHLSLPEIRSLEPEDAGVQARSALLTFIAGALAPAPGAQLPLLSITGPARSGKTTTTACVLSLLSPSTWGVITPPRDASQLAAVARNVPMLAMDNNSTFTVEMSDLLCSVSSGATYATRKLYTNGHVSAVRIRRPAIVNGIEIPMRSDLHDRALRLTLAPYAHPRDEVKAEAAWEAAKPAILGAMLEMMADALAKMPMIDLDKAPVPPPRFRHAATLGEAMARTLGWPDFLLIEALDSAAREGNQAVVSGSPLALRIARVLGGHGGEWDATPADWLSAVNEIIGTRWGPRGGPRTPDAFSRALARIETALRTAGWTVDRRKRGKGAASRMHIKISAPAQAIEEAGDAASF